MSEAYTEALRSARVAWELTRAVRGGPHLAKVGAQIRNELQPAITLLELELEGLHKRIQVHGIEREIAERRSALAALERAARLGLELVGEEPR